MRNESAKAPAAVKAQSAAREPLNHPLALLGLAALCALTAAGAFALSFRIVRARVAPARWPAAAAWLALAAFVLAAVMLLCAGGGEERAVQYDVFVSYAHDPVDHKAWVKSTIVAPLAALSHADGTPYRIFFDEAAIKVGRQWKTEIELALLGSRCFLPVYSERYFERPYCREEIEMADQLRIEGRLRVFPVARTVEGVPERYLRKVQYIDARASAAFMGELSAQIAQAVATSQGSAPSPSAGRAPR